MGVDVMATQTEIQIWQRGALHTLLKIRAINKGINIAGLDEEINALETKMGQEEVAWVKEKIAQMYGD
ncbi:MAG: hypothetical protein FWE21_04490 [Defluviitaleaceae bacterium]|nr:hypothetical protein [Defluviitaleaceae bacterium]